MRNIINLAAYLGVGALLHAFFVGPTFDWNSAWTWGWLLGWPAALVLSMWGLILGLGVLIFVIVCVIMIWEKAHG